MTKILIDKSVVTASPTTQGWIPGKVLEAPAHSQRVYVSFDEPGLSPMWVPTSATRDASKCHLGLCDGSGVRKVIGGEIECEHAQEIRFGQYDPDETWWQK